MLPGLAGSGENAANFPKPFVLCPGLSSTEAFPIFALTYPESRARLARRRRPIHQSRVARPKTFRSWPRLVRLNPLFHCFLCSRMRALTGDHHE